MNQPSLKDSLDISILAFFTRIIETDFDHSLLQDTSIPSDALIKSKQCVFTLKELHGWVFDEDAVPFADFKRFLYQSTLNQQLQQKGFEVGIEDNQGKIAHSRYILKRQSMT